MLSSSVSEPISHAFSLDECGHIYKSFLVGRSAYLHYRGYNSLISPSRGCAQGSKSGPILWNIFFDPILSLPFPPGVHAQAFADDLQLVISGDPNLLTHSAQTSINLIAEWCLDHKLTLSPNKSSILPIFCNNPTLNIFNSTIPCTENLLILGVTFNSRLSFSPHHNEVCSKMDSILPRLSACANFFYGFGHKARKLLYISVIEPVITYAAHIWAEAADTKAGRNRLRSLQRKACIKAIHGFRSTPIVTAIALLRVLPLDMKIKLLSDSYKSPSNLPFRTESAPSPYSYPQPHLLFNLNTTPIPESTPDISIFTDGSKTSSGVGSGILFLNKTSSLPLKEYSIPLAPHCTVFQAESFALLTALLDIQDP
ncbi:hypothetical protein LAZ67_X004606 [Cordylochernes scorpioides]|uniref:Reverse transcriptase domain-containing protein n=1 Tax=Cordylochernes scorpioides TaxID=51811 RepID=A0ABY6LV13_9ARAC|nr:hypothetical protein LAZ67_X004606 [Cordylochernes scorpioides]